MAIAPVFVNEKRLPIAPSELFPQEIIEETNGTWDGLIKHSHGKKNRNRVTGKDLRECITERKAYNNLRKMVAKNLSEDEKGVIMLSFFRNLSDVEISVKMRLTLKEVEEVKKRALDSLFHLIMETCS